jgi:hypothetical protein
MPEEATIRIIPWTKEEYFKKRDERNGLRNRYMKETDFYVRRFLLSSVKKMDLPLELHERLFPEHMDEYTQQNRRRTE